MTTTPTRRPPAAPDLRAELQAHGRSQCRAGFQLLERRASDRGEVFQLSVSSELPVERWFGLEVLDHRDSAVDLARLNDSAPVLWNHDSDQLVGVVDRAWLENGEKGRRLMVELRFGNSAKAQEVRADVEAGILRNVSIGYEYGRGDDALELLDGERVLVRSWTPFEVSWAPVPADQTVGIGRSQESRHNAGELASIATPQPEPMANTTTAEPGAQAQSQPIDTDKIRSEAVEAERQRMAGITRLCREHDCIDLEPSLNERGATLAEATAEVLKAVGERMKAAAAQPQHATPARQQEPVAGSEIGLTDREATEFSLCRLLSATLEPQNRALQEAAAFEIEACAAAAEQRRAGKRPSRAGLVIPEDVLQRGAMSAASRRTMARRMGRALSVGSAANGGNVVFDEQPGTMIDVLRNSLALAGLGAQVMTGLTGDLPIPRKTAGASVNWVAENGTATESNPTFEQISLTPHTLTGLTELSRKFILQANEDAEAMVRADLLAGMALEIDRAALYGDSGSDEPTGLTNLSPNTQDFAATNPTYAEIVGMESLITADNADVGSMAYITTPALFGGFKTTEKASGTAQFIYEPGGTVNGYPVRRSAQVEAGDVWLGVWSEMIMGFWSGLDIQIDPYTQNTKGAVRVLVFQDVDVQVRHPESFCRGNASVTP